MDWRLELALAESQCLRLAMAWLSSGHAPGVDTGLGQDDGFGPSGGTSEG